MIDRVLSYVKSVRAEVARVSWPTRNEVISLTALILLLVIVLTVYVWGIDGIIGSLLRLFVR